MGVPYRTAIEIDADIRVPPRLPAIGCYTNPAAIQADVCDIRVCRVNRQRARRPAATRANCTKLYPVGYTGQQQRQQKSQFVVHNLYAVRRVAKGDGRNKFGDEGREVVPFVKARRVLFRNARVLNQYLLAFPPSSFGSAPVWFYRVSVYRPDFTNHDPAKTQYPFLFHRPTTLGL